MEFKALFENFAQEGKVIYISIRSRRLQPVTKLEKVLAIKDKGLEGDRYNNQGGARQVTLIQAEHLKSIASFIGRQEIDPALCQTKSCCGRNKSSGVKRKGFSCW
jgi:MOSC domain-containing protein YiiM